MSPLTFAADASIHELPLSYPLPSPLAQENGDKTIRTTMPTTTTMMAKERRDPSVTPRKFKRFFTPRSHGSKQTSNFRQTLYEITARNRGVVQSSPLRPSQDPDDKENNSPTFTRDFKRRKIIHTPESSPSKKPQSRLRGTGKSYAEPEQLVEEDTLHALQSPSERASPKVNIIEEVTEDELELPSPKPLSRIVSLADCGLSTRLLQLSLGGSTRGVRDQYEYPVNDWQSETAPFHSRPADVYTSTSIEDGSMCIPFCATSCNTNTLTAVGDEEGRVRLLESGKDGSPAFKDVCLSFQVHGNAIIDMAFTEDDSLLATASGDSTARVVDMVTQTTIAILGNHCASVKQVRFQPGMDNHSVLATSSRDGSVQIWDLRCKGVDGPVNQLQAVIEPHRATTRSETRKLQYGRPIKSIFDAHKPSQSQSYSLISADAPSRGEASRRAGDVSVTALEFLPSGQEHLLLTASEADASVKLWDIRSLQNKHKGPLSVTRQPDSHTRFRHFGITSMNLGNDGTRLYTVCKDNTIYAYSTAHLILGHAPELSLPNESRRLPQRPTQEGLGPIYGFRHPKMLVTSFYVKSAIRKAKNGHSEVLAVGSSDGCAMLFPTDERYLPKRHIQQDEDIFGPTLPARPSMRRVGSGTGLSGRMEDSIPISTNGTALIRGHDREIGPVTWNPEGELITVGDDYLVRVWRQGEDARDLRMGGEAGGRRWGCGYAEIEGDYDEDDG